MLRDTGVTAECRGLPWVSTFLPYGGLNGEGEGFAFQRGFGAIETPRELMETPRKAPPHSLGGTVGEQGGDEAGRRDLDQEPRVWLVLLLGTEIRGCWEFTQSEKIPLAPSSRAWC